MLVAPVPIRALVHAVPSHEILKLGATVVHAETIAFAEPVMCIISLVIIADGYAVMSERVSPKIGRARCIA